MNVQRKLFLTIGSLTLFASPFLQIQGLEILFALLCFFGLGIPHGALDMALGKSLLQPKFKSIWWILFIGTYLAAVLLIVTLWHLFPLPSFLFFLSISIFHFGFSDTEQKKSPAYYFEALGRGVLPLSAPAFFYPEAFRSLIESSLTPSSALFVQQLATSLFYPTATLYLGLIAYEVYKNHLLNSLELALILLLFIFLSPFTAFIVYFCFLHSLRHIVVVLEEMRLPLNKNSLKWVVLQSLPATLSTLSGLLICYFVFKERAIDIPCIVNLFFISLAALTFPHMLLVETFKLSLRTKTNSRI